jgi:L-seryl-tRNA(Ser) seleniumtransferase
MQKRTTPKTAKKPSKKALSGARGLPSVSRILESRPFGRLTSTWGRGLVTDLLREALDEIRAELRAGGLETADLAKRTGDAALARRVDADAKRLMAPSPRTVINATGVVVHTNLGRSVLSQGAARRVAETSAAYMDLEYDLATGKRGSRLAHLEPLLARLFPGHGSVVVNNNAAAVMLALRALARRKEVIVSRGELVEIGGSFRVPDILSASGARLSEVGTTNRTRLADYEKAIGPKAAAILKVHTSNFRIVGFTEETTVASLAGLARRKEIPLIVDWGSGDLVDLGPLGIHDELPVRKLLDDGADLVTFSGDKLLGGPQAGFVIGRPDLIARLRKDPLARVCRLDRLMLCAMRETLAAYVRGRAFDDVPTLQMLALTRAQIGRRATRIVREVAGRTGARSRLAVIDGVSRTGGGSSPTGERPTRLISVGGEGDDAAPLERALRLGDPPIVGRVHEGKLLLDLRTVLPEQDEVVAERLTHLLVPE